MGPPGCGKTVSVKYVLNELQQHAEVLINYIIADGTAYQVITALAKELSMSSAARIINCNKSTISRHMSQCIPKFIADVVKLEPAEVSGLNVVNQLLDLNEITCSILEDARADGDNRTALKAIEVAIKQLEVMAKLTGQLSDAPQINFLVSPEYMALKQVLITALAPYHEAREAVADALMEIEYDTKA